MQPDNTYHAICYGFLISFTGLEIIKQSDYNNRAAALGLEQAVLDKPACTLILPSLCCKQYCIRQFLSSS